MGVRACIAKLRTEPDSKPADEQPGVPAAGLTEEQRRPLRPAVPHTWPAHPGERLAVSNL